MPSASTHTTAPALDARFLRRVHLASLVLTLVFALIAVFYASPSWGLGFLCAGSWSTANLWVLERLLRAALRPSGRDLMTIVLAGVVKLPVLYGLLVLMFLRGGFAATAMLIGLSMPLLVVVLKAVGQRFVTPRPIENAAVAAATSTPHPRS